MDSGGSFKGKCQSKGKLKMKLQYDVDARKSEVKIKI